jgi:Family of unknown function (DUF6884)
MTDRIRVITTCTSRKLAPVDPGPLAALPGLEHHAAEVPAEELYTGEQHRRLMRGVNELREHQEVEVWVMSARAGLIAGDALIGAYDESFAGMDPAQLRLAADRLRIPQAFRDLVGQRVELTLVLTGNGYFDAAQLEAPVRWGGPTVVLASPSRVARLPAHRNLRSVAVSQSLAKQWSLPLTLLKGEIVRGILIALAHRRITPQALFANEATIAEWCRPRISAIAC